jgi:hypothetical protein
MLKRVRKAITKRDHKLVDYDRFNNSYTKLRDKKEKSLNDEKNLFKVRPPRAATSPFCSDRAHSSSKTLRSPHKTTSTTTARSRPSSRSSSRPRSPSSRRCFSRSTTSSYRYGPCSRPRRLELIRCRSCTPCSSAHSARVHLRHG